MRYLDYYPFSLPFNFTAIPGALGTNVANVTIPVTQGDFVIHGLTTWNTDGARQGGTFNFYRLQWTDEKYANRMMTDEMSMGAFEADAQLPFSFPCSWVVRLGSILNMQLRNMTAIIPGSVAANVTTQHVLYGRLYPRGYTAPIVTRPWIISTYFNLGFQEDTTSGGNVVDSYNLNCSFSKTMDPLKYDFLLRSITADTLNFLIGANAYASHRLKITDKVTSRLLFDKSALIGEVAGIRGTEMFANTGLAIPAGWPTTSTLKYDLAEPILFKKNSVINIHLGMAFSYGPNTGTLSNNNGECNVLLIGERS